MIPGSEQETSLIHSYGWSLLCKCVSSWWLGHPFEKNARQDFNCRINPNGITSSCFVHLPMGRVWGNSDAATEMTDSKKSLQNAFHEIHLKRSGSSTRRVFTRRGYCTWNASIHELKEGLAKPLSLRPERLSWQTVEDLSTSISATNKPGWEYVRSLLICLSWKYRKIRVKPMIGSSHEIVCIVITLYGKDPSTGQVTAQLWIRKTTERFFSRIVVASVFRE